MIIINTVLHNYVYYRNSSFVDHSPPCYAKVSIKCNCTLLPHIPAWHEQGQLELQILLALKQRTLHPTVYLFAEIPTQQ